MNTNNSNFNFKTAQAYELESSKQWIRQEYCNIISSIALNHAVSYKSVVEPVYLELFFNNNREVFYDFFNKIKHKECLEVSSGPCGIFPFIQEYTYGQQFIIDPLIVEYDKFLREEYGRSWFNSNIVKLPCKIEDKIEALVNKIGGFIIWRNGLDHLEDPDKAIEVMSSYAIRGCKLLFWSDILHIEKADEGHINVLNCTKGEVLGLMNKKFIDNGWRIEYHTSSIRDNTKVIDYGCVAFKI